MSGERPRKRPRDDDADAGPVFGVARSNPHVRQALEPGAGYESRADIEFSRRLEPDAPRAPYRRRERERKTVVHWGQRKLFLAELEFLVTYATPGATVLYAGAAPGTHLRFLAELLPALRWVLVDPGNFAPALGAVPGCVLRQEMFTDDTAREFAGRDDVLFISDVRSGDWHLMGPAEMSDAVERDMRDQQRWHDLLRPRRSLLKFRLPWGEHTREYLAGDLFLPAFGPPTTTETRLVPHGHGRARWDCGRYERQMFYFNTVTRVARYWHDVTAEGLDHCYDCRAEVAILRRFLASRGPVLSEAETRREVGRLSAALSREICGTRRTLADPTDDPDERTEGIRRRQWVDGRPAYAAMVSRTAGSES
jgi:hypothetical protein